MSVCWLGLGTVENTEKWMSRGVGKTEKERRGWKGKGGKERGSRGGEGKSTGKGWLEREGKEVRG